jgi:DNA-binding NtrC family response regulator
MADLGPILVVVGGDTKRVQWLTHHVTSQWPNAQVTTLRAGETAPLSRLISERTLDAVILQADFANDPLANSVLNNIAQLLRIQPALYCILLAENGNEMSGVRALKIGAKDYIPLAQITRDQLLAAVGEACAKRRVAAQAAAMMAQSENSTDGAK